MPCSLKCCPIDIKINQTSFPIGINRYFYLFHIKGACIGKGKFEN